MVYREGWEKKGKEDLSEYIEWLWENEAEKLTLGLSLCKARLSPKEAEMCAARPEILYQAIDAIMQERDNAIE